MRILGIYIQHDACAAIFDDYTLIAAVAQERPTRRKGDGGRFPTEAARKRLEQAGLELSNVDVVCLPRTRYPKEYFTLRALGARSIMAAAVDRKINDWLNQRLERTEFMPFAPVVRKERCERPAQRLYRQYRSPLAVAAHTRVRITLSLRRPNAPRFRSWG